MNGQELEVASSSALDTAMTDDDELETVCRICRMPAEADNPLYHPCRCSGSIRYVHSSCLNVWLARSKHDSCEVCASAYLLCEAELSSHVSGPQISLCCLFSTLLLLRLTLLVDRRKVLGVCTGFSRVTPVTSLRTYNAVRSGFSLSGVYS